MRASCYMAVDILKTVRVASRLAGRVRASLEKHQGIIAPLPTFSARILIDKSGHVGAAGDLAVSHTLVSYRAFLAGSRRPIKNVPYDRAKKSGSWRNYASQGRLRGEVARVYACRTSGWESIFRGATDRPVDDR